MRKSVGGTPITKTRQYGIWQGMKQRCYNPNNPHYKNYGAKGIEVCEEWIGENGFINFYQWSLSHGYADDLSIDRVDSNTGYSPANCIWSTSSRNGQHENLELQLANAITNAYTYENEFILHQLQKVEGSACFDTLKRLFEKYKPYHEDGTVI